MTSTSDSALDKSLTLREIRRVKNGLVIGQALRRWRYRTSLSQEALAARASISPRHLSRVECGKATASLQVLFRLAEALELNSVERDQLLEWVGLHDFAPEPEREIERALARFPVCELNEAGDVIATNAIFDGCLSLVAPPQSLWQATCGNGPRSIERLTTSPSGLRGLLANPEEVLDSISLPVGERPPERYRFGDAVFSFRMVETRIVSAGHARIWLSLVPLDAPTRHLIQEKRSGFES